VVRHRLVKQILRAYNKEHEKENPQDYVDRKPPTIMVRRRPSDH
jgi:hypothetical protein